jgi:acetyl esterase/lipase
MSIFHPFFSSPRWKISHSSEHSFAYAQRLLEAGIHLEYHLYSEGGHGLGSADGLSNHGRSYPKRLGTWLELAVNWLNAVFKHEC